jgi:hypothetical protein
MTQLATDDTQLRQMSVNSQARVQDAFTWEVRGQQWAQLYVDIASKGIPAR